jgi:hypothetical protein
VLPAQVRERQSWINLLVNSTIELEPPASFWWWSGIGIISAIVKKNVWIDRYSYILYPNVYIILVSARSGLRKGIPISYANSIVEKVGTTRIIAGRNSVQGVVKSLSEQFTTTSGVKNDAQAFLCAAELDSFMVKDDQGLSILTDLYNTHEYPELWKNTLKGSPVEALKQPCITLLAASNERLFENVIQDKDIEGGFIARSMIVHEKKRRSRNSLMFKPEHLLSKTELAERLFYLRDVKGQMNLSPEVRIKYDKWYNEQEENEDRTGSMERIGDHILKVAMLISLSKGPELMIQGQDLDEAIEKCISAQSGTRKISMTQGPSEIALFEGLVLKALLTNEDGEMERTKMLSKLHGKVDSMMLDRVMDDLGDIRGRGHVQIYRRSDRKIYYKLKEEVMNEYRQLKGKVQ